LGARPKFAYLRSESYRRFVASFECFSCRIENYSQAAHSNQAKHGHGRGIKSSDEFIWPLCCERPGHMGCHKMHDLCIDMTKDERDEREEAYILEMQSRASALGWINGARAPKLSAEDADRTLGRMNKRKPQ
jgi:hypothetical protein